jgi:serine/threonine protein kinase
VSDEGFIRLAALVRLIAEPLAAMHSLNLAHRDLKEDNILAMRVAPGVKGNIYYNTAGKKWTGRLGDCGKALCFDVEFETETGASASASKRSKNAVDAIGIPAPNLKQGLMDLPRDEFRAHADMASKTGTAPLAIPMSIIYMIDPVALST